MSKRQGKQSWWLFGAKAIVVSAMSAGLVLYASDRYTIGRDLQEVRSIVDSNLFLVDHYADEWTRGDYIAFLSHGLDPYFEDGTRMAKKVVGMPGDQLVINPSDSAQESESAEERLDRGVWINGRRVADDFMHQSDLGLSNSTLARDGTIPDDHYFVIGTTRESYDSRYWGYVEKSQVIGTVTLLP